MKQLLLAVLAFSTLNLVACNTAKDTSPATPTTTKSATDRAGQLRQGDRPTPLERADRQTDQLTERLQLDSKQEATVREINRRYAEQRGGQRGGDRQQARGQMREQLQAQDREITAVLTTTQRSEYDKLKAERREQMQQHRRQGGGRRG